MKTPALCIDWHAEICGRKLNQAVLFSTSFPQCSEHFTSLQDPQILLKAIPDRVYLLRLRLQENPSKHRCYNYSAFNRNVTRLTVICHFSSFQPTLPSLSFGTCWWNRAAVSKTSTPGLHGSKVPALTCTSKAKQPFLLCATERTLMELEERFFA